MIQTLDEVVLKPGDSVSFENRDDLLETLDRLDLRPPGGKHRRHRTRDQREHWCILRYLRFLAGEGILALPVTLRKTPERQDPPDFALEWADGRTETIELTEGSTREYQKALSHAREDSLALPVDIDTPNKVAAELWADILFTAFLNKARVLLLGRFSIDHLIIYDLTGLGLLIPMEESAPLLRQRIQDWQDREQPAHSFTRISVLKDQGLLLDIAGAASLLRAESPYYRLSVIRAAGAEDLRRRLRAIDRYCRDHSILHLKLFGSILGDWAADPDDPGVSGNFGEDSDLDLLVEFEPGTRVTLLDMARMERELSEMIGFKVDLRTAGDLSRYFREEVLAQAVEL